MHAVSDRLFGPYYEAEVAYAFLPPEWNLFGPKFLRTIVCCPPQSRAGNSRLLNPNIIPGGALAAFMSCIEHPAWFD